MRTEGNNVRNIPPPRLSCIDTCMPTVRAPTGKLFSGVLLINVKLPASDSVCFDPVLRLARQRLQYGKIDCTWGASSWNASHSPASDYMSSSAVKLLVFGDSWAKAEGGDVDTWPELLAARHCGRRSINLALPFASSSHLDYQLRRLDKMLDGGKLELDPDVLAIVHCGGNDLHQAEPAAVAAIAASSAACGLLHPPLANTISLNLQQLVEGLIRLGVMRVALVGVPLTACIPLLSQPAERLIEPMQTVAATAIELLMRGCNRVILAALRHALVNAQRTTGVSLDFALALDEARAINDACRRHNALGSLWQDVSHPSQALHTALAIEMQGQLKSALMPGSASYTPFDARACCSPAQLSEHWSKDLVLPKTPSQGEIIVDEDDTGESCRRELRM